MCYAGYAGAYCDRSVWQDWEIVLTVMATGTLAAIGIVAAAYTRYS